MTDVLVLAAHPDDEVLGAGGTIAKMTEAGDQVTVAILGEGVTSREATREETDPAQLRSLRDSARRASAVLGVQDLRTFNLPDNRFDTVPLLDIVKRIESLISELQPSVVYTQHGGDLNIDHQVLFRATLTATRPLPASGVRELYAYEVASSTEYSFHQLAPRFQPNTFEDISSTLGKKLQAMRCYDGEKRAAPHPRSPEALEAIAHRWGSVVGRPAAEAFQLIRAIRY